MLMNAIIRRKSTERHKVAVEIGTYDRLRFISTILSQKRMVEHSLADALRLGLKFVADVVPIQAKILARFYVRTEQEMAYVYMPKELKEALYEYARNNKVTASGLIDAVVTIFTKSVLSSMWRDKGLDLDSLKSEIEFIIKPDVDYNETPKIFKRKRASRKLNKADINIMRHHNYMTEFTEYMQKFGGMEKWLNKNVLLMIHAKPLANTVGKSTDQDVPKEHNPGAVHMVRLWKRGRGYNLTVLGNNPSSYGEDAPELEPGSVYRLYDIYRNIDWLTITLT